MKRAISILMIAIVIISAVSIVTACGGNDPNKLSGTYAPTNGTGFGGFSELKFSGNKITLKMDTMGISQSYTTTYTFDGANLTFKISELGAAGSFTLPCTKNGDTLTLSGTEYKKK